MLLLRPVSCLQVGLPGTTLQLGSVTVSLYGKDLEPGCLLYKTCCLFSKRFPTAEADKAH